MTSEIFQFYSTQFIHICKFYSTQFNQLGSWVQLNWVVQPSSCKLVWTHFSTAKGFLIKTDLHSLLILNSKIVLRLSENARAYRKTSHKINIWKKFSLSVQRSLSWSELTTTSINWKKQYYSPPTYISIIERNRRNVKCVFHAINDTITQNDPCSIITIGGRSCNQIHFSITEDNCQTSK
jgi:hypothetical protein